MKQEFKLFLDTNILVHASLKDFDPDKHFKCSEILKNLLNSNTKIYISTQILREFFAIVTHVKYLKNPLSIEQANSQIKFFQSNFITLPINNDVINRLIKLTITYSITGQKVHDTTIAATLIDNKIKSLLTYNIKDFIQFKEIKPVSPLGFNL